MRIDKEQLIPTNTPLVGFGGTKVYPLGAVMLPATVGDYLQQIIKDVTFLIVDRSSAYNAILGRPTLNSWKVVTSTYYLMIKFPTEYGVGELRGDQVATCKCYIAMLETDNHVEAMDMKSNEQWQNPLKVLKRYFLTTPSLIKQPRLAPSLARWSAKHS